MHPSTAFAAAAPLLAAALAFGESAPRIRASVQHLLTKVEHAIESKHCAAGGFNSLCTRSTG